MSQKAGRAYFGTMGVKWMYFIITLTYNFASTDMISNWIWSEGCRKLDSEEVVLNVTASGPAKCLYKCGNVTDSIAVQEALVYTGEEHGPELYGSTTFTSFTAVKGQQCLCLKSFISQQVFEVCDECGDESDLLCGRQQDNMWSLYVKDEEAKMASTSDVHQNDGDNPEICVAVKMSHKGVEMVIKPCVEELPLLCMDALETCQPETSIDVKWSDSTLECTNMAMSPINSPSLLQLCARDLQPVYYSYTFWVMLRQITFRTFGMSTQSTRMSTGSKLTTSIVMTTEAASLDRSTQQYYSFASAITTTESIIVKDYLTTFFTIQSVQQLNKDGELLPIPTRQGEIQHHSMTGFSSNKTKTTALIDLFYTAATATSDAMLETTSENTALGKEMNSALPTIHKTKQQENDIQQTSSNTEYLEPLSSTTKMLAKDVTSSLSTLKDEQQKGVSVKPIDVLQTDVIDTPIITSIATSKSQQNLSTTLPILLINSKQGRPNIITRTKPYKTTPIEQKPFIDSSFALSTTYKKKITMISHFTPKQTPKIITEKITLTTSNSLSNQEEISMDGKKHTTAPAHPGIQEMKVYYAAFGASMLVLLLAIIIFLALINRSIRKLTKNRFSIGRRRGESRRQTKYPRDSTSRFTRDPTHRGTRQYPSRNEGSRLSGFNNFGYQSRKLLHVNEEDEEIDVNVLNRGYVRHEDLNRHALTFSNRRAYPSPMHNGYTSSGRRTSEWY